MFHRKAHGDFHVPRNETHFKVNGNFHVPCLMMCCERYMEISMYLAVCFAKEKLAEVTRIIDKFANRF